MSLDSKIRAVVKRVMRQIGTLVTVQRVTLGDYITGSGIVAATTQDFDVYGRLDEYEDRELAGSVVSAGDRKLSMAAADVAFVPAVHDKVLIADEEFSIIRVTREMAQHEPAMYVLQLRQ